MQDLRLAVVAAQADLVLREVLVQRGTAAHHLAADAAVHIDGLKGAHLRAVIGHNHGHQLQGVLEFHVQVVQAEVHAYTHLFAVFLHAAVVHLHSLQVGRLCQE